jgi:hypothetical protein
MTPPAAKTTVRELSVEEATRQLAAAETKLEQAEKEVAAADSVAAAAGADRNKARQALRDANRRAVDAAKKKRSG